MMINTVPSYSVSYDVMLIGSSDNQDTNHCESLPLCGLNRKTFRKRGYRPLNDEAISGKSAHSIEMYSTFPSCSFSELTKAPSRDSSVVPSQLQADESKEKLVMVSRDGDLSSISSLSSSELKENQDFQSDPLRFFVLLFYCISSFSQVIINNTWNPIADSVLFAFPMWKSTVITLLANWSSLTVLVFIFPACWLLNKKGLRFSFMIASGLSCTGAGLRCLSMQPNIFVWSVSFLKAVLCWLTAKLLHLCAILNAMAGVLLGPSVVILSSLWFPPNERTTATGVGTALSLLGIAGSYQLGPFIVQTEPPRSMLNQSFSQTARKLLENDENVDGLRSSVRQEMRQLMLICFWFEMLIFVATILIFPEKPLLPSSRASCISLAYRFSFIDSLRSIIRNRNIWALCISAGLCTGMTVPWLSLLTVIFSHRYIPQTVAAQLGVWTIVCTCLLSLSVSRFSDLFQGHLKLTLLIFILISSAMFIGILRVFLSWNPQDQEKLCLLVLLGISSSWSTQALFYELGSEIAYPIPEGIVAGFMTWLSSLCTAVAYLFLCLFPRIDDMWLTCGAVVYNLGAFLSLLTVEVTYNRSAVDKGK